MKPSTSSGIKYVRLSFRVLLALSIVLIPAFGQPRETTRSIDLSKLDYPPPPCDYMFQYEAYPKRHIEFLDSERLLVSFPLQFSCSNWNAAGSQASKFRSIVIDKLGQRLASHDWSSGENVQAGPDGHVLLTDTGKDIQILDAKFRPVQDISLRDEGDSKRVGPWLGYVTLAPSRHGFLVNIQSPNHHAAYFEGIPAKQTATEDSCDNIAVVDGGFACVGDHEAVIHMSTHQWKIANPLLDASHIVALPTDTKLLVLTNKFELYEVTDKSGATKLSDLRWMAPGWNAGFRYDVSAQRVLFFSHGARFPISDTSGFGKYLKVGVLDLASGAITFRKQYALGSDVAMSPDGHLLAVREKSTLNLVSLP